MEKRFFLIDASYKAVDGVVEINIVGRDKQGKRIFLVDNRFGPYFYVTVTKNLDKVKKALEKMNVNGKTPKKIEIVKLKDNNEIKDVLKVFVGIPSDVPEWRRVVHDIDDVIGSRENDIPFIRRYFIDNNLRPFGEVIAQVDEEGFVEKIEAGDKDVAPRILSFDIETYATDGFPLAQENPIIMISLFGCGVRKVLSWKGPGPDYAEVLGSEFEMIARFIQIVNETMPDILLGYNSDNFDFPYIKERCRQLGIKLAIGGSRISFVKRGRTTAPSNQKMLLLDVYPFIANITSKSMKAESLDLGTVAQELLGTGKEDLSYKEMMIGWDNGNLEPLYAYSIKDSEVTHALAVKLFSTLFQLSQLLNISIFDISRMSTGQIVEWFLLSMAKKRGILAPNRPKRDEQSGRMGQTFTGGFVKEPQKGLHENIAVCDFRSLYPTIIVSHNVGPDTLGCKCCKENMAPSGDWFCTKQEGFLPSVLKKVLGKRFELKAQLKKTPKDDPNYAIVYSRQNALKLIANSFYGYLGFFGARWYSLNCARAVTSWGRDYIQKTMELAEEQRFDVIYGDTDSLFISLKQGNFEKVIGELLKTVNKNLPEMMELELEGTFKRGIFLTKKRYAMVDQEGNIVVKGLERVRRDWAPIARQTQEAVLKAILNDNDLNKAVEVVQASIARLKKREASVDEVAVSTQLTRDPEKYEQMAPHVKVALRLRRQGKTIRQGSIVTYIITPGLGSISDRARPVEESQNYDPVYYIEHHLIPPCKRILDALNLEIEDREQSKLDKFF